MDIGQQNHLKPPPLRVLGFVWLAYWMITDRQQYAHLSIKVRSTWTVVKHNYVTEATCTLGDVLPSVRTWQLNDAVLRSLSVLLLGYGCTISADFNAFFTIHTHSPVLVTSTTWTHLQVSLQCRVLDTDSVHYQKYRRHIDAQTVRRKVTKFVRTTHQSQVTPHTVTRWKGI